MADARPEMSNIVEHCTVIVLTNNICSWILLKRNSLSSFLSLIIKFARHWPKCLARYFDF